MRSSSELKVVVFCVVGIVGAVMLIVLMNASQQLDRANRAHANYDEWSRSPEGLEIRRYERELRRDRMREGISCYLKHAASDYIPEVDCPEDEPANKLSMPTPLNYPSIWDYTFIGSMMRTDLQEGLFAMHMTGVDYWADWSAKRL